MIELNIANYKFQMYNPGASSTYKNLGSAFTITYGDGTSYSGTAFYDKLNIAGATVSSQQMVQVTTGSFAQGDTVTIFE